MSASDKASSRKQIGEPSARQFAREVYHLVYTSPGWAELERRILSLHSLASTPGDWQDIRTAESVEEGTFADLRLRGGDVVRAEWVAQEGLLHGKPARAVMWWPVTGGDGLGLYTPVKWRTAARTEPPRFSIAEDYRRGPMLRVAGMNLLSGFTLSKDMAGGSDQALADWLNSLGLVQPSIATTSQVPL